MAGDRGCLCLGRGVSSMVVAVELQHGTLSDIQPSCFGQNCTKHIHGAGVRATNPPSEQRVAVDRVDQHSLVGNAGAAT